MKVERWFQNCLSKLLRCREMEHFCLGYLTPDHHDCELLLKSGSWQLSPWQCPSPCTQPRGQALHSTCQLQTETLPVTASRDHGERHSVLSPGATFHRRDKDRDGNVGIHWVAEIKLYVRRKGNIPVVFSFLLFFIESVGCLGDRLSLKELAGRKNTV